MSSVAPPRQRRPSIQITGDSTADWMLIVPGAAASMLQVSYQWESRAAVQIVAQPGGASLLSALIATVADAEVRGIEVPPRALSDPSYDGLTRAYSVWQPYPAGAGSAELVWRMHQLLGVQRSPAPVTLVAQDATGDAPDCLVIEDANLGFRECVDAWPACLTDAARQPLHIILKRSNPLAGGRLWDELLRHHADRLTVYCSANDLRKEYAPLGQALSWERTASDLVAAVRERADLSGAARVIVSLGLSGAIIVERDGPSTLVFDPTHQEGDWERPRPGTPTGLGTCLTSALAVEAAANRHLTDWAAATVNGLMAGRALHTRRVVAGPSDEPRGFQFPTAMLAPILRGEEHPKPFRPIPVPDDAGWRIYANASTEDYRELAGRIVVEGDLDACRDMPVERVGGWASLDRTEIESMRSVRNIINEYLAQGRRGRPLSLAVFGPPGSGKSFAIKHMARESMTGPGQVAILEFNLSQFSSPADLPAALQRVRDCTVGETLPLVFWDEFDTPLGGRELGWLAQFLAPMQDGLFLEHGNARPIGPAIFIFAGGAHPTMASFKARAVEVPSAKATDFLSRLRGYVDILGPNPASGDDETFLMRRALLLRALLLQKARGLFHGGRLDIDPGVLRAFIDVTTYVHGARSMESIVDMSALSGKTRYERSALPPQHQLSLHVDADEFLGLVRNV
ncbi:MAG TPA: AAA family ATPase [Thermomicrobiales bacterium]|nr:AAA family ATPase [Thermomicrobiales bacterium]